MAKKLAAKVRIARGAEEEAGSGSEGEGSTPRGGDWGRSKAAYYGADTGDLEGSEDEQDAADEEEEALRLQRAAAAGLRPEDFGLEGGSEEEEEGSSSEEEGVTLGAAAARAAAAAGGGSSGRTQVEAVPKDLSNLSEEAKRVAVEQGAQELSALIGELRASLAEVRGRARTGGERGACAGAGARTAAT